MASTITIQKIFYFGAAAVTVREGESLRINKKCECTKPKNPAALRNKRSKKAVESDSNTPVALAASKNKSWRQNWRR